LSKKSQAIVKQNQGVKAVSRYADTGIIRIARLAGREVLFQDVRYENIPGDEESGAN
jgi:hypothetical protein